MKNILLVFIGGGIGSVLRYWASILVNTKPGSFPYSTFAVNILGSLLIGILFSCFAKYDSQGNRELLLITGLCGGFTTFSAFSKECFVLIQQHQWTTVIIYILLSVLFSIASVAIGYHLAKSF